MEVGVGGGVEEGRGGVEAEEAAVAATVVEIVVCVII